jgi:hypothetical protein
VILGRTGKLGHMKRCQFVLPWIDKAGVSIPGKASPRSAASDGESPRGDKLQPKEVTMDYAVSLSPWASLTSLPPTSVLFRCRDTVISLVKTTIVGPA